MTEIVPDAPTTVADAWENIEAALVLITDARAAAGVAAAGITSAQANLDAAKADKATAENNEKAASAAFRAAVDQWTTLKFKN